MGGFEGQNVGDVFALFRLDKVVAVFIGFLVLALFVKALKKIATKVYKKFPSRRLVILQFITIISFFVYVFGGSLLAYAVLQPSKEILFALTGSAAVAIGFSLKDLVSSIVAGIILLFDKPFQVGDRVTFGDVYGEIQSIGLRAVKLMTLDDNLVTIPNSRFLTDVTASGNAGALEMMVVTTFHLAIDADLDRAHDTIREVVATSKFVYLENPIKIIVEEVAVAERLAIKVCVKAYVIDAHYEKDFQTDLVMRLSEAFAKRDIKRPQLVLTLDRARPTAT